MRGTIVIEGPQSAVQPTSEQPLFLKLDLDLDAPHLAKNLPANRPDATRGAEIGSAIASRLERGKDLDHQPGGLMAGFVGGTAARRLDDQQAWDMVAWALSLTGSQTGLAQGKALYTQNCLACHGESGQGDGVMVRGSANHGS